MKYAIDMCSILEGSIDRNYEKEFFPVHWRNFDVKIDEGLVVSTSLVYQELEAQDDEIFKWAKNRKHIFMPPIAKIQTEITNLEGSFPSGQNTIIGKKLHGLIQKLLHFLKQII